MSKRLDAIERRQMWPLNGRERARLTAALTIGTAKAGRHKSTAKQSAAVDRVWDDAARRVQAEEAAVQRVKDKKLQEKAEAKAARKGWF